MNALMMALSAFPAILLILLFTMTFTRHTFLKMTYCDAHGGASFEESSKKNQERCWIENGTTLYHDLSELEFLENEWNQNFYASAPHYHQRVFSLNPEKNPRNLIRNKTIVISVITGDRWRSRHVRFSAESPYDKEYPWRSNVS
jgi:hypothetical protein